MLPHSFSQCAPDGQQQQPCSLQQCSPAQCRRAASWRRRGTCRGWKSRNENNETKENSQRVFLQGGKEAHKHVCRCCQPGRAAFIPRKIQWLYLGEHFMSISDQRAPTRCASLVVQGDEDVGDERRQLRQHPALHLDPLLCAGRWQTMIVSLVWSGYVPAALNVTHSGTQSS